MKLPAENINRTQLRVKHGIKEELIALVKIKNIGRVRARRLYRAGIRSAADIKKHSVEELRKIIGPKTADKIKKEL